MRYSRRIQTKISRQKENGSALAEYSIVLVFMSLLIYLSIVEGITFETGDVDAFGNPVTQTIPALTQTLAEDEDNFINALSLP